MKLTTRPTTPLTTPSMLMAYDMIPEVFPAEYNPQEPMWKAKSQAIQQASAYIAISHHTAEDLRRFYPQIQPSQVRVCHCGVDSIFSPPSAQEIENFKTQYGIKTPYFLMVGSGVGYKNGLLFLHALNQLWIKSALSLVITGAGRVFPPEWRALTAGVTIHGLQLEDSELRLAYGGAIALVYPSRYEGFGLPVAEAMACGCPVITTSNSSLKEVGGNAVLYVPDRDVGAMTAALLQVFVKTTRQRLMTAGLEQSRQFSWTTMTEEIKAFILELGSESERVRSLEG